MDRPTELSLITLRERITTDAGSALRIAAELVRRHELALDSVPSSLSFTSRREQAEQDLHSLQGLVADIEAGHTDDALRGIGYLLMGKTYEGLTPDYFSMDDYFAYEDE